MKRKKARPSPKETEYRIERLRLQFRKMEKENRELRNYQKELEIENNLLKKDYYRLLKVNIHADVCKLDDYMFG